MSLLNRDLKVLLINFLLLFLPLSFILGNPAININIIFLILVVIFSYKSQIFKLKFLLIDKILVIIFFYILACGILNNYFNFNYLDSDNRGILLMKTLSYTRYLFLYFVIKFLAFKKLIEYKFLFISCGLFSFFVSVDLIVQFFVGKDLFGFEGTGRRLSGPFGDEYIAGSYIQKFFIFMPLSLILYWTKEKNFFYYLILFTILFTGFAGLVFSGNRIPLILFILSVIIFFIYQKEFHKILIITLLIFGSSVYYLLNNNEEYKTHLKSFASKSFEITEYLKDKLYLNETTSLKNTYIKEIETGILTWKQNKIFGGGIKSFYYNCVKIKNSVMNKYGGTNCSSHPHNYYLQIAVELGLIGLIFIAFLFSLIIFRIIKLLNFSKEYNEEKKILVTLFALFFVEIFPFKTTGSFFTTTTSTYIFILIPLIINFINYEKIKNNEK